MYVKISRSKFLINSKQFGRPARKTSQSSPKCNHCGGLIRENGEIEVCIMCGRERNHYCNNCQYAHSSEVSPKNKKSA